MPDAQHRLARAKALNLHVAWAKLTAQEARVVRLIVEVATYQKAAEQLFLSPRTVESHVRQS